MQITRGEVGGLGFANVQEVFKPTKTGLPKVVDAPENMVGWFQQHPYLQTDKPESVRVGGVKGEQLDVVVGNLPEAYSGVWRGLRGPLQVKHWWPGDPRGRF